MACAFGFGIERACNKAGSSAEHNVPPGTARRIGRWHLSSIRAGRCRLLEFREMHHGHPQRSQCSPPPTSAVMPISATPSIAVVCAGFRHLGGARAAERGRRRAGPGLGREREQAGAAPRRRHRAGDPGAARPSLVEEGELLFRLEPVQAQANADLLSKQLDAALAQDARLVAERDNAKEIAFPQELLARRQYPRSRDRDRRSALPVHGSHERAAQRARNFHSTARSRRAARSAAARPASAADEAQLASLNLSEIANR